MASENRTKILQQAEKLSRQGKIELAIKEYQKILDVKPDDLSIRQIIGDLKIKLNRPNEAIAQFTWVADYYLKEGFFTKAIAMYKRITRIDQNNEDILFKLADLYSKQGLIIEAKHIYLELAEEYKRQNNQKKALGIYKKILEFDRMNIKMRLLLADNYLREKMTDEAVNEYLIAADILTKKKEFKQAEEILLDTYTKAKNLKTFEKLVTNYIAQGNESKAIQTLTGMGGEIYKHLNLLKILGELFFKNNRIEDAERIYKKIAEIDPNETEVIMKLGKVYLQREEFQKAFDLFTPTIDKFIADNKFDEATTMLRFIITSNNTFLPALTKLSSIFKLTGKTNSLIALYESLIPIYEQREMKSELSETLKNLIEISDSPHAYQEQLAKLSGEGQAEEGEKKQEREFISFQLKNVEQAIRSNNLEKAAALLITAKDAFPNNLEIRLKLFDVYQLANNIEAIMTEGIELLQLYKRERNEDEHKALFDKLSRLKPNDERLLDLGGHEKTNIEITFDKDELIEQIDELAHHESSKFDFSPKETEDEEVFELKGEDSLMATPADLEQKKKKGLSTQLVELDFYISEGYFDEAGKILEKLREEYPQSREIISRLERIKKGSPQKATKSPTPHAKKDDTAAIEIESSITDEVHLLQENEDSKVGDTSGQLEDVAEIKLSTDQLGDFDSFNFEMEREEPKKVDEAVLTFLDIDKEQIIQAPSARPPKDKSASENLGSSADFLDIDSILADEEPAGPSESPFKEIDELELAIEGEDEFQKEDLFLEEERYLKIEKHFEEELKAIQQWMDEIEKQRTSTIEKNMMEIFKEFKKGVDEKIGYEDYDTRYNLGIAYKEMGLLEEAIHEFLISSKNEQKFFDSAGLLGICFRDKGMLDESISWFEKALEITNRQEEEYKAVKYELVLTAKLKEDYAYAKKLVVDILKTDQHYRNIRDIYEEIKNR